MKKLILFFSSLLIMAASQAQIPTDGLIAYYPFSGSVNDFSGNGHHGTVNGAIAATDRAGNPNSAYLFDGMNTNITFPAFFNIGNEEYSLSMWININDITQETQCCFNTSPHTGIGINYNWMGIEKALIYFLGDGYNWYYTQLAGNHVSYHENEWYHIILIKNGINYSMYINDSVDYALQADSYFNNFNLLCGFYIGSISMGYENFNGKIDDIRIYNRALTPDEILALYNEVLCNPMPTIAKAGPDQVVMFDTTTFLQGNTPVEGTGLWTIVSGTEGTLDDPYNPTSAFHGAENHSFTLKWTISNESCSNYDEVMISLKPEIPVEGLVAYYPFNGSANDESGNSNNGIANGTILTTDRFGVENKAYGFDGINDRIEVENSNSLNITGSISISVWVNSNIFSGRFVDKGNTGSPGGYVFDVERGWFNYRFLYGITSGNNQGFCGSRVLPDNQWINLLVTHDSISGISKLFLNGILTNSIIQQQNTSTTNTTLWIGAAAPSGGYFDPCCFLNAKLDDIRIYNRDLILQEIQALFHEDGWAIQPSVYNILYDKSVCKNDSISFSVLTIGIPPIHYQWQKDGSDITGATDSVLTITHVQSEDVGGYRCVATNYNGTGTSNTAILTVEFAAPTFILGDTTVTLFQVATYSVDNSEGHAYNFEVEGGTKVDGTDNSITVHWSSAGLGLVKLIELSELGCYADTNTLEVNIGNSGITDQETQNLMIYPNPASGKTTFHYALAEPSQVTLLIYNAYGQQTGILINENQQKGNHEFLWDVAGLPSGIYFYRLKAGNKSSTGKLVVVK